MIERVARALYAEQNGGPDGADDVVATQRDGSGAQFAWEVYEPAARAAIEATREPLVALMAKRRAHYERKAGEHDPLEEDNLNRYDQYTFAAEAMDATEAAIGQLIDAALTQKTQAPVVSG